MKHSVSIALIAASLVLGACKKDEPPAAEPEPSAVAQAPAAPAPAEQEPEPTAEQVPIPEDFEAEAREQVTADTLRAQLDALEKEINAQ